MKNTLILICILLAAPSVFAQLVGKVIFDNFGGAGGVMNGLTGNLVTAEDGVRVGFYLAPDGATNAEQFVYLPPSFSVGVLTNSFGIVEFLPGYFDGGVIAFPVPLDQNFVMVQARAWEGTYGTDYEHATAAGIVNGRTALRGVSSIIRTQFGRTSPHGTPDQPPVPLSDLVLPFTVTTDFVRSLSINDIDVAEKTNGTVNAVFTVNLTNAGPSDVVRVDYTTVNGSALAGQDYIATNGTLVFNPGETQKTITVVVIADLPHEPEEKFFVQLSNPINGYLAKAEGVCFITEVQITNISVDTVVSFNTLLSRSYVLERSEDMTTWIPIVNNITGNGGIMTVVDVGSGCLSQSFYRARLLP